MKMAFGPAFKLSGGKVHRPYEALGDMCAGYGDGGGVESGSSDGTGHGYVYYNIFVELGVCLDGDNSGKGGGALEGAGDGRGSVPGSRSLYDTYADTTRWCVEWGE